MQAGARRWARSRWCDVFLYANRKHNHRAMANNKGARQHTSALGRYPPKATPSPAQASPSGGLRPTARHSWAERRDATRTKSQTRQGTTACPERSPAHCLGGTETQRDIIPLWPSDKTPAMSMKRETPPELCATNATVGMLVPTAQANKERTSNTFPGALTDTCRRTPGAGDPMAKTTMGQCDKPMRWAPHLGNNERRPGEAGL